MKYIVKYKNFENVESPTKIEEYPLSVKRIYNRFNERARKSIDDNPVRFAKIAKKIYYNANKNWKEYFKQKEVKNLNNLTEVMASLENWIRK